MLRKIKPQYNTLEELKHYVEQKDPSLQCKIEIDQWVDTLVKASNKCLVIKKSATAGAKIILVEPHVVGVEGIMPGHFFNNFRRGIVAMALDIFTASGRNQIANQVDGWMKEIEN